VNDDRQMQQVAPYPAILASLVERLRYRDRLGWEVALFDDYQRDKPGRHSGESRGLTLVVTRCGPDTYHPERTIAVNHLFPVPPATYDLRSWQRWLFDRLGDVDLHERMEDFVIADSRGSEHAVRPYAPNHGPGNSPYIVFEHATDEDRRTSFRGDVNPE
jgi:hypothetical protein